MVARKEFGILGRGASHRALEAAERSLDSFPVGSDRL
jgi:hypothetical protein